MIIIKLIHFFFSFVSGVGFMVKTAAKTLKPTLEVDVQGDTYVFRSLSTFKNTEIKFKLGEEFEEDRADGKRVKV